MPEAKKRPSAAAQAPPAAKKRPAAASPAPRTLKRPAAASLADEGRHKLPQPLKLKHNATTFLNPILNGGFPDPSVCVVGDDIYMANSTFEYFPGIPIHHSKDLVNWTLVGHGLHRPEQVQGDYGVNLVDVKSDDGIQAPSLRYHNGTFYIITTCVYRPPGTKEGKCTNFIITANSVEGPWSNPHVIEDAPGIDPDIFFDDDGKVWYVGTHPPHENPNFVGEGEIWCQELDLNEWALTGERHYLWRGACHGGVFVEGPHVYKVDGRYYLLVAEGGTGVNHAVMIASSDSITGPYVPNERNPLITSRNLSYENWVHSTGHGDLFRLADGRWFMALLGIRGEQQQSSDSIQRRSAMGRETFLVPIIWEQEPLEWSPLGPPMKHWWPVAAPPTGNVERVCLKPFEDRKKAPSWGDYKTTFRGGVLDPEWIFRRTPRDGTYSRCSLGGRLFDGLRLFASPETFRENTSCSFMGVRQREHFFDFKVRLQLDIGALSSMSCPFQVGLSIVQTDEAWMTWMLCKPVAPKRKWVARFTVGKPGEAAEVLGEYEVPEVTNQCEFRFDTDPPKARNRGLNSSITMIRTGGRQRGRITAKPIDFDQQILSLGYMGACLGIYCTTNGEGPAIGSTSPAPPFVDILRVEHRYNTGVE
mmetsp:Transcript_49381/g.105070  ORF Transcript_49381/g.105070 Transcript_49381/m.105070 type:complete len:644 (-) Transcript_49381:20-1951(-)